MTVNPSLTVITPVYNEEDIVVSSINETYLHVSNYFHKVEYIIVNDGSTDRSRELIVQHFKNKQPFKIIEKENGGFGSAIKTGISGSNHNYIVCIPADSPLDDITTRAFAEVMHSADIIVSYRIKRLGYSPYMLLNSRVFHFLVSTLFSMNLKDYNWIHFYKKEVFEKVSIESSGLFMLAEVLIKARNSGFTFAEIPVHQKQRLTGIATASKPMAVIRTIIEMMQLFVKDKF